MENGKKLFLATSSIFYGMSDDKFRTAESFSKFLKENVNEDIVFAKRTSGVWNPEKIEDGNLDYQFGKDQEDLLWFVNQVIN